MKISQLFSLYSQVFLGDVASKDVTAVTSDSRKVLDGAVFVAVKGHTVDGHDFVSKAVELGAIALVVEDRKFIPEDFTGAYVVVERTPFALNQICHRFYGESADRLFCVGITGTNGKTSLTHFIESILKGFNWKTGVIGTIDHHLEDKVWQTELTTPDTVTLYKRLQEFESLGARALAMEISSIALEQDRIEDLPLDVAVFTNLTQDHLDYHKNMEEYFSAKRKLFDGLLSRSQKNNKFAIVNSDDPWGKKLLGLDGIHVWSYGRSEASVTFKILERNFSRQKIEFSTPRGKLEVDLKMAGLYNAYNAAAALSVGLVAGLSLPKCKQALEEFEGVPGRLQRVVVDDENAPSVFVDYAHTNDALENVLASLVELREHCENETGHRAQIFCVFGCGGDRDKGKRPLMGTIAAKLADVIAVTSDNPRTEDPQKIIDEIKSGIGAAEAVKVLVQKEKLYINSDRRHAIRWAIEKAKARDIVLIAGKGHEDYQILGKEKVDFSDFKVASEFLVAKARNEL